MADKQDPITRGQIFTVEDGVVVVEWYHFGDDAAYEFAEQVRLNQAGQTQIAMALGLSSTPDPDALMKILKERFRTYFAVREFADAQGIAYEQRTEMSP